MRGKLLVAVGLFAHAFFAPISIAGTQIGLGVAALGLAVAFAEGFRPRRTALDWPALAFVLACLLSDLWSPFGWPSPAFATLWRSIAGFFVVAHGLSLLDARAPGRVVLFAAAGLALASMVGLVQYRNGFHVVHLLHLRVEPALVEAPGVDGRYGAMGFFTSRLTFGHNAALVLALLAGRPSPVTVAAIVLGLAAVFVTFDRAAYLGLFAAAAALVAVHGARRWLVITLVVALAAAAIHPGVRARFRSSFDKARNADRVFIWDRAKEIIADHPLRGIGFGNYPRVCGRYYDRVDPSFPMRTWAHNTFLSLYAETGPLGTAAFLWLLVAAAIACRRKAAGLAALLVFVVVAQFHDVLYDTKVMYPLWLALGVSLAPRAQSSVAGSAAGPRAAGGGTSP